MKRHKIDFTDFYAQTIKAMTSHGLLLGSYDSARKPNIMTIGWGTIGNIWGMPIWTVLVRPSRHTYFNIEHTGCFTVNVPGENLGLACAICGTKSGKEIDKFAECELTAEKASNVWAPVVAECPIVYECQVVHRSDVMPERLADEILSGAYVDGDYHRVYFGKILAVYANDNAAEVLS